MKRFFATVILVLIGFPLLFSQTEEETTTSSLLDELKAEKRSLKKEDILVSEVFSDIWQNTLDLKTQALNRGYNMYFMVDNPLAKSNFAVAFGLGMSFHNMYSNSILKRERDTLDAFTGRTEFEEIPENYSYKKNKLALMYVDVPIELRFRTKDITNNFKIAIGFKIGYNLKNYIKYHGDVLEGTKGTIKYKEYNIENIEKLRYGVTARIGYGQFNAFAFYALTPLLKKDSSKHDELFPISVGVAYSIF